MTDRRGTNSRALAVSDSNDYFGKDGGGSDLAGNATVERISGGNAEGAGGNHQGTSESTRCMNRFILCEDAGSNAACALSTKENDDESSIRKNYRQKNGVGAYYCMDSGGTASELAIYVRLGVVRMVLSHVGIW